MAETAENSRTRLLTATIDLVRANGYAATRVEDVCAAAGVTKGSFFHHFASKEELAIAAAAQWNDRAAQLFAQAPYLSRTRLARPAARLRELPQGTARPATSGNGAATPAPPSRKPTRPIRRFAMPARSRSPITSTCCGLDDRHALLEHPVAGLRAESLAIHIQAVLQGAFVMAKARQDVEAAHDSVDHLYRYVELLFGRSTSSRKGTRSQR